MHTRREINAIKRHFKPNTRIKLDHTDDPKSVPDGTMGTIKYIDDMGQIHVTWDNGSSIALIVGLDDFTVLATPTNNAHNFNNKIR